MTAVNKEMYEKLFDLLKNKKQDEFIKIIEDFEEENFFNKLTAHLLYYSVVLDNHPVFKSLLKKIGNDFNKIFEQEHIDNSIKRIKLNKKNDNKKLKPKINIYKFLINYGCPDDVLETVILNTFTPHENVINDNNHDDYCVLDELILRNKFSIVEKIIQKHEWLVINFSKKFVVYSSDKSYKHYYSLAMHLSINGNKSIFDAYIEKYFDNNADIPPHLCLDLSEISHGQSILSIFRMFNINNESTKKNQFICKLLNSEHKNKTRFIPLIISEQTNKPYKIYNYCTESTFLTILKHNYSQFSLNITGPYIDLDNKIQYQSQYQYIEQLLYFASLKQLRQTFLKEVINMEKSYLDKIKNNPISYFVLHSAQNFSNRINLLSYLYNSLVDIEITNANSIIYKYLIDIKDNIEKTKFFGKQSYLKVIDDLINKYENLIHIQNIEQLNIDGKLSHSSTPSNTSVQVNSINIFFNNHESQTSKLAMKINRKRKYGNTNEPSNEYSSKSFKT